MIAEHVKGFGSEVVHSSAKASSKIDSPQQLLSFLNNQLAGDLLFHN
jgi:hypothetical protein